MEPPATQGAATTPTRLARGLLAAQAALSVLAVAPASRDAVVRRLALVPQNALPRFHLWTLLTGACFDDRAVSAALAVAACALCGRPAELALGRGRLGALWAASAAWGSFVVASVALVAYALAPGAALLFTPIATAHGLCLATLVALKCHIPDHEVGFGAARLRVNYAPLAYTALLAALAAAGQLAPLALLMALASGHAAWAWLRYVARNAHTEGRGDASESFAFATFFPPRARPLVAPLANAAHSICAPLCGLGAEAPEPRPKQQLVNTIVQDRASAIDAERRRQRAQKALDERMAGSSSEPAI